MFERKYFDVPSPISTVTAETQDGCTFCLLLFVGTLILFAAKIFWG